MLQAGYSLQQLRVFYLGHCDATLLCQLLFCLLARVRVTEVGVEVLIQDLCRLLIEIPPFSSAKRNVKNNNSIIITNKLFRISCNVRPRWAMVLLSGSHKKEY